MENDILLQAAQAVVEQLKEKGLTVASAESCTGGLVAETITQFSGASEIFELGIVSYSNRIKSTVLGVDEKTLKQFGAVSRETAIKMACLVREKAGSDFGVSVTGVAGPSSSEGHPAGYVFVAVAMPGSSVCRLLNIQPKSREFVRKAAATELFKMLYDEVKAF